MLAITITSLSAQAQSFSGGQGVHQRVNQEALSQIRDKQNKEEREIIDNKVSEVDTKVAETNAEIERMKNEVTAKDNAIALLTRRMVLLCRKMGLSGSECNMTNPVTNKNVTAENSFCYASGKQGNYRVGQWMTMDFNALGSLTGGYQIRQKFEIPAGSSKRVQMSYYGHKATKPTTPSPYVKCSASAKLSLNNRTATNCKKNGRTISCPAVAKWSSNDRSSNRSNDGSPHCGKDATTGSFCIKGSKCYSHRTKISCGYKKCPRAVYRYCR